MSSSNAWTTMFNLEDLCTTVDHLQEENPGRRMLGVSVHVSRAYSLYRAALFAGIPEEEMVECPLHTVSDSVLLLRNFDSEAASAEVVVAHRSSDEVEDGDIYVHFHVGGPDKRAVGGIFA